MDRKKKGSLMTLMLVTLLLALGLTVQAASPAAKIGSKSYATLSAAVKAAKDGSTVRVQKDLTAGSTLNISKSGIRFTIDFGGHSYKYTGTGTAIQVKKGTATLKNAKATASKGSLLTVVKGAKAVVSGGSYTGGVITNKGTLTVKSGSFQSVGTSALVKNSGAMTVEGGTFIGKDYKTKDAAADRLAMIESSGTLTVKGGKFSTDRLHVLDSSGIAKFTGGTLNKKKGMDPVIVSNGAGCKKAPSLSISGKTKITSSGIGVVNGMGSQFTMAGGTLTTKDKDSLLVENDFGSTAKLSGGTLTGGSVFNGINGAKMTIGGKVKIKSQVRCMTYSETDNASSKITIIGGTITYAGTEAALKASGSKAVIVVKGGTITAKKAPGILMEKDGTITVKGGTINAKAQ